MKILKDTEINPNQWLELLNTSPTRNFFQSKACYDFYSELTFLKSFAFALIEKDKIQALVCGYIIAEGTNIKRYFSKRAIVPGGMLIASDASDQAVSELLSYISNELQKKAIYIEFRNYIDFKPYLSTFEKAGFKYYAHLNFHLKTPTYDEVWSKLSKSKRRQISLSLKSGATISEAKSIVEVREYYTLIYNLYKYKIKLPLFPVEFFEKLFNSNWGKIILVKYNQKIVGGITCVLLQNDIVYEWFVCGDDTFDNKVHPSVLATWAGIEYAIVNKFSYFDFMGAGKPNTGYGVFEFKSKFGGNKVEDGRFVKINNLFLFKFGSFAIKTIQKLKIKWL